MVGFMWIFALFLTFVLVLVPHLLWLFLWLVGRCIHFHIPYSPFGRSAVFFVLLGWGLLSYGFFVGRLRYSIKEVAYVHPSVPKSFDGYKVVQISDFHLSTFEDRPEVVQRMVDSVNAQNPDLICFTGDLISLGVDEALPYAETLRKLSAKDGVVSVLGNHDFMIYSRKYKTDAERKAETERLVSFERDTLKWRVLRNENYRLRRGEDSISVLGVDNHSCKEQGYQTVSLGDLPKAMAGTEGFRFLLSHDPTHWDAEVLPQTDIPLQLSGHTHSAQIRFWGWSPASWVFDEVAGLYKREDEHGERTLYVNVGLGCTLPIRIGCDGEISVITFHSK